jgi:hypothetical protein
MQGVSMTIETIGQAAEAGGRGGRELAKIGRQFGLAGSPILMPVGG